LELFFNAIPSLSAVPHDVVATAYFSVFVHVVSALPQKRGHRCQIFVTPVAQVLPLKWSPNKGSRGETMAEGRRSVQKGNRYNSSLGTLTVRNALILIRYSTRQECGRALSHTAGRSHLGLMRVGVTTRAALFCA
jgi:hypothetical protein